jgi:2'-5' RNA ligase
MADTVRLFVALDLPGEVRAALAAFRDALDGDVWRPVADDALHITLVFLGARPVADVELVAGLLQPSRAPALVLGGVALLPPRRARVLAVDVDDPDGALGALQHRLADALAAAGVYTPERRAYRAHTTVARLRPRARPARTPPTGAPEGLEFRGEAVTLYRSSLHPHGARYEALRRMVLTGP